MFIVYQNGTEVVKLHHAYLSFLSVECDVMHSIPGEKKNELVATYPTHKEAKERFNDMIYYLRREELVYEFPQPRTSPVQPLQS